MLAAVGVSRPLDELVFWWAGLPHEPRRRACKRLRRHFGGALDVGLHRALRDRLHAQHRVGRLPGIGDLGARVGILVEDDDVGFAHLGRLSRALFRPAALGPATIDAPLPAPRMARATPVCSLAPSMVGRRGASPETPGSPARPASVPRGASRVSARSGSPGGSLEHATSARKKKHSKSSAALGCVPPTSGPV
jgi:hypothetical protein